MRTAPSDSQARLLAAEDIELHRHAHLILHGVDLSLREGEIVTVIGPNGAGKTTLLRILLGLLRPTGGRVWRAPRLRVGYMPQRLAVDPTLPLTVDRFLGLAMTTTRRQRRAVLAEVGIPDRPHTALQSLSGGEMQRTLLARALLRDPNLLMLDEPAQGVDVIGQSEVYRLLQQIRDQRGCGILMVSHDLHLVMAASDHVLCLNRHVCCQGAPESVSRHPEYQRLFRQLAIDPSDNLGVYVHAHDHHHDLHGEVIPDTTENADRASATADRSRDHAG
jgi:zinc transport system ATP-binding protein